MTLTFKEPSTDKSELEDAGDFTPRFDDRGIFERTQIVVGYLAAVVPLPRRQQRRRAREAADLIGAERRHCH